MSWNITTRSSRSRLGFTPSSMKQGRSNERGLGYYQDDPQLLAAAIRYLEKEALF